MHLYNLDNIKACPPKELYRKKTFGFLSCFRVLRTFLTLGVCKRRKLYDTLHLFERILVEKIFKKRIQMIKR